MTDDRYRTIISSGQVLDPKKRPDAADRLRLPEPSRPGATTTWAVLQLKETPPYERTLTEAPAPFDRPRFDQRILLRRGRLSPESAESILPHPCA